MEIQPLLNGEDSSKKTGKGLGIVAIVALVLFAGCVGVLIGYTATTTQAPDKGYSNNCPPQQGVWSPLVNRADFNLYGTNSTPSAGAGLALLLTDGTVLVQNAYSNNVLVPTPSNPAILNSYPDIFRLTPDAFGSYVNGTWSRMASLPVVDGIQYAPNTLCSAVLPDGRVVLIGAEYNGLSNGDTATGLVELGIGAILDPTQGPIGTDGKPIGVWTPLHPPPFFTNNIITPFFQFLFPGFVPVQNPVGGSMCVVLDNGTLMISDVMTHQTALLDANTLTWTQVGLYPNGTQSKRIQSPNFEEGWTKLPSGKLLTVNTYTYSNCCDFYGIPGPLPFPGYTYPDTPLGTEIFDPTTLLWSPGPDLPVPLTDQLDIEVGPAPLRPDGTVFATGSSVTGNTAIYDPVANQWTQGPSFPVVIGGQLGVPDGPAAVLPNGNVLVATSTGYSTGPTYFFEFDGTNLNPQPQLPNVGLVSTSSTNQGMLVLPTGQIMLVSYNTDVYVYTSNGGAGGGYDHAWRPSIVNYPSTLVRGSTNNKITGYRFNGMTEGAYYGDDGQSATAYPLVRVTNVQTGHVKYCRTHNHSSMILQNPNLVWTYFDVPSDMETGRSKLEVVTNGIPSSTRTVTVQ